MIELHDLINAKAEIDERLENTDLREQIPDYIKALEIASMSIEKQINLYRFLNIAKVEAIPEEALRNIFDTFSVYSIVEVKNGSKN